MNYRVEVLCCFAAVIAYVNTFQAEFVYDDNRAILKNVDILPTTPLYKVFTHDFWGTPMIHSGSHKSYRPITVLTFRINYIISRHQPWSYHVTNTMLHAVTTWLFVIFIRTRVFVTKSEDLYDSKSLISGLIFALHPIHTEAVAGVVGRADVLATLFTLAALISYTRICDLSNRVLTDPERHRNESLQATRNHVLETFRIKKNPDITNTRKRRNPNKSLSRSKYQDNRSKTRRKINRISSDVDGTEQCKANFFTSQDADPGSQMHAPNKLFHTYITLSFLFALLALLSKEQGICALPLCGVYDIWLRNGLGIVSVGRIIVFPGNTAEKYRKLSTRVRTIILSTVMLILLRTVPTLLSQTGDTFSPSFSSSDNPASASNSLLTRTLTFHYLLAFNARLLCLPSTLSYDWSMDSIPLIETVWDFRNLLTLALYLIVTTIVLRVAKILRTRDEKFSLIWSAVSENKRQTQSSRKIRKTKRNVSPHCELTTTQQLPNLTTHFSPETKRIIKIDECLETERGYLDLKHMNDKNYNKYINDCQFKPSSRLEKSALDFVTGTIWLPCSLSKNSPPIESLDRTQKCIHHGQLFPFEKDNQERTNSSGYATDNSLDCQEDTACKKYDLKNCRSKFLLEPSGINDETGSFCSDSSFETSPGFEKTHDRSPSLTGHIPQNPDIILMGVAMMIISFLPATNLVFYVGFVVAERLLYMPSMGYCILIVQGGWLLFKCFRTMSSKHRIYNKFPTAIVIIVLLAFATKTISRNADWKNENTLYRSGVTVNPAKSWANLGNVLKVGNKIPEAEFAYLKALNSRGNMADVHYNLGLLYQEQTRYEDALGRYSKAIFYRPTLAVAHLNRGIVLAVLRRPHEAETAYRRAVEIDDYGLRDPQAHAKAQFSALYNLGCLLASQNRHEEAVDEFMKAVERVLDNYEPQSLYNMLGQSLHKLGRLHEAENWFKTALTEKPDHIPAHLTYARLLSQQSRTSEAEGLYRNSLRIEPDNHMIYHHLGLFYLGLGRREHALRVIEKGIYTPSGAKDYDILMTAANMYKEAINYLKSEEYYRRCTRLKPESAAAHMNLGAILHLQGNLREAQASYMKALSIQPNEQLIRKNLGILKENILRNTILHKRETTT